MTIFWIKKTPIPIRIIIKLILEIDLFVRQGRGVLHTPHMYLDSDHTFLLGTSCRGVCNTPLQKYRICRLSWPFLWSKKGCAISHDPFYDQKNGHIVSHNPLSIQIKCRYISHRSLFDQKEVCAILHELFFDSGKSEYVLQDYILDRKY